MEQQAQVVAPDEFVPMTDDQVLNFTQKVRRGYIDHAVKEKVLVNGDPKEKTLVLGALNDMSRDALTSKRIKSDEKVGAVNGQAAMMVASMLARMPSSAMRHDAPVARQAVPALPDTVPSPAMVPGETEVTAPPMNYESFMEAQGKRFGINPDA